MDALDIGGERLDPFAASVLTLDRAGDAWRDHVANGLAGWRGAFVVLDPDGTIMPSLGRTARAVAPGSATIDTLGDLSPWTDAEAWARAVNCVALGLAAALHPEDLAGADEGDAAQALVLGLLLCLLRKEGSSLGGVASALDGGARWLLAARRSLRLLSPRAGARRAVQEALERALPDDTDADRVPRLRALDAGCRAAAACLRRSVAERPHLAAGSSAASSLIGGRIAIRVSSDADAPLAAALIAVAIIRLPDADRPPVLLVVPRWEGLIGWGPLAPILVDLTRPRRERVAGLWAFVRGDASRHPDGGLQDEMLAGQAVMTTFGPNEPRLAERLAQALRGTRSLRIR